MRKKTYLIQFAIIFVLIGASCSKSSTPTPLIFSRTTFLAGTSGSSKNWKLTSITEVYKETGFQTQTYNYAVGNGLPSCVADNIFTFSNNSTQTYSYTEGATKCTTTDTTAIESGSWAFTNDGNSLLIDSYNTIPQSEQSLIVTSGTAESYLYDVLFSIQRTSLSVTQLTATAMTLSYSGSFTDSNTGGTVNYTITLVFSSGG